MDKILEVAIKAVDEKMGQNIVAMDFRGRSPLMDYFVICSAENSRNLNAIAQNVEEKMEENGYGVRKIEGQPDSGWVLIDAYDVVVHVFSKEQRAFYSLEKLWMDVPGVDINEVL